MGTSTRYQRAHRDGFAAAPMPAGGGGSDDDALSAALRAFGARCRLVTDCFISPATPSITDFPAISILLVGHARLATPFYCRTPAASVLSIPTAFIQRAAMEAARAMEAAKRAAYVAILVVVATRRATEAAKRAAAYADAVKASLDQLIGF